MRSSSRPLQDQRLMETYTMIVYGSSKVASYHRKTLNINDFNFNLVKKADLAHPRRPNIVNIVEDEVKIDLGKSTPIAGELSLLSLEMAISDLLSHNIDLTRDGSHQQAEHPVPRFYFSRSYRIPGAKSGRIRLPYAHGQQYCSHRGDHRPYSPRQGHLFLDGRPGNA